MTRQEHLLVILMEECAEVQKECAKALRFGLDEYYGPVGSETNRDSIIRESADFLGVLEMLQDAGCLSLIDQFAKDEKKLKVEKFLEYSRIAGTLD